MVIAFEGVSLLAKILEQNSLDAFRDLDRDLFVEEDERRLFQQIRRHLREHGDLPYPETMEQDTGIELPEVLEPYSFYHEQIHKRALHNASLPLLARLRETLTEQEPEGIFEIFQEGLALRSRFARKEEQSLLSLSQETLDAYDDRWVNGSERGVTTGYPLLDQRMMGHQPGDFNIIVSRPKMGKTTILLKNGLAARHAGHSVLVVTMEMTAIDIFHRMVSYETGVATRYMRSARMSTFMERAFLAKTEQLSQLDGFWIYTGELTGTRVSSIHALIERLNPGLILVDGLYLLKSAKFMQAKTDRWSNIAYVAEELRQMALTTNKPVVATTQFSREAGEKGKKGSLENLGYTDALGQLASYIWALQQPEGRSRERLLRTIAAREGGEGTLRINFKHQPMDFSQIGWLTEEEEEAMEEQPRQRQARPVRQPS